MNFDTNSMGQDRLPESPQLEAVDHWLDDALRAVTLPEGFFARMSTLADLPPVECADNRDRVGRLASTRGLADATCRCEASTRDIRPR